MLSSPSVWLCLFMVPMIIISSPGLSQVFGDSVTSVILVDSFPQALVFNPSNNNIYAANRDSGTVSVIETNNNTVIKSVGVGASPHALVFNSFNNNIYVTNRDSGTVSVIETDNNVMSVTNTDNMILFFDLQNRIWNFQLFVTLDISIVHIKP
jgi:YVTN family beta-propeller protein